MNKDLVPIETKKAVLTVQQKANALTVSNPDEAEAGAALLKMVKTAEDGLIARKEEITRPLMISLASVRDLFKPFELNLGDAKKTVKAKLLAYQIEMAEKIEKQKARVAAKVAKGTMRADTAVSKMEEIGEVKAVKGIQTRTLTKVRVIDEFAIPREYLVPDMTRITQAILREGIEIPGVERYEEKILAVT